MELITEFYSDPFNGQRGSSESDRVCGALHVRQPSHMSITADATHTFLNRPQIAIGCCGELRTWFVNRNGRTRCATCDDKELDRLRSAG